MAIVHTGTHYAKMLADDRDARQREAAKAYAMRETLKHFGLLTAARDEIGDRKRMLKSTTAIQGAL